jgi:hypothetical protein
MKMIIIINKNLLKRNKIERRWKICPEEMELDQGD